MRVVLNTALCEVFRCLTVVDFGFECSILTLVCSSTPRFSGVVLGV